MASMKQNSEEYMLSLKTVTWQKDSHSLFDYEFNKNVIQHTIQFSLNPKFIFIFRNNPTSQVTFLQTDQFYCDLDQQKQLMGCIHLKQQFPKRILLQFYNASQIKAKMTPPQNQQEHKQEDVFLIVRSLKNKNNQNKGYRLNIGQVIKLGRVQYRITSINNSTFNSQDNKTKFWTNNKKIKVQNIIQTEGQEKQTYQCKYCMIGENSEPGYFLCSPCKCSGSCGMVHFKCLETWNQSKVKKQVVGGTIQYNFQKFFCEVCKQQYPRFIQKDGVDFELLPIQKPSGHHLVLEGMTEKSNNMMVIQNIPGQGIKIGRGHECQIRITDISVSRSHARIEKQGDNYLVFDNKSKFGTLVKQQRLTLELSRIKQGVQIGRTVITFEKSKKTI